jgi:hypothetical protein
MEEDLESILKKWVEFLEENGIKQQTAEWHIARKCTIGGSSMATIQGINPYSSVADLIRERLGLAKFNSDIKPQWGNLFEDVLKRFVEHDLDCTIRGEDLYVLGPPGSSYSPDGLAVVNRNAVIKKTFQNGFSDDVAEYPVREVALMEFKCPYSRIPNGTVPKYYVPQVLMGLDLLNLPSFGIFVEAVIRRCSWEQLDHNPLYDRTLVPRSSGNTPLAYGFNGFYIDRNTLQATTVDTGALFEAYRAHFGTYGDDSNDYLSNDLGESPPSLFTLLMAAMDKKLVSIRYSGIYYGPDREDEINNDLQEFHQFCKSSNHIVLGVLPWKIFRADYHIIEKIPGYLDKWYETICGITDVIKKCEGKTPEEQNCIIDQFCGETPAPKYKSRSQPTGFSDD